MRLKLHITEDDIKEGRPDCFTCPIALELNRHLADGFCAAVYPTAVEIYQVKRAFKSYDEYRLESKTKRVFQTDLPKDAIRFIRRFDGEQFIPDRKRLKPPPRFTLTIPNRFLKSKKKSKKTKTWWEN